jgi:hypothetical protein
MIVTNARYSVMIPARLVVIGIAIVCAAGVVFGDVSRGQEKEEGLLELHLATAFASLDTSPTDLLLDGEEPLSRAGLSQGCEVLVFGDLSKTRLPAGTRPLDLSSLTPVKRSPVNQDGTLYLYLPPGRYSVVNHSCIPVDVRPYIGPITRRAPTGLTCCPRVEADPPMTKLRTESGDWVIDIQTVDVRANQTTRATILGLPEEPPSKKKVWAYIAIVVGLVLGASIVGSIGVLRPKFNPISKANRTKELNPDPDPDHRPADFDDVFGDFLRRR